MGAKTKRVPSRVVVVEDDPTFLSFWERILTDLNIGNFEIFSDPRDAVSFLKETPCHFLISGIIMPSVSGYDLARIVRERNPACQIVLTTAFSTDLSRFDLAGIRFHLLHKPYTDIHALRRFLKHLLDNDLYFDDLSEDSFSENEDYPQITEWKL